MAFERFTVYTDHAALRWLLTIAEPSGRLARWRLRLSEFEFEIKYKKGTKNTQADALSRLPTDSETVFDPDADVVPVYLAEATENLPSELDTEKALQPDVDDEVDFLVEYWAEYDALLASESANTAPTPVTPITWGALLTEQLSDEFCSRICGRVNAGELIPFVIDDRGYLIRTVCDPPQLVIPQSLRARLIHAGYHALLAGHPGGRKLYDVWRRHFYWPSMALESYNTVKNCVKCAKNRIKLRKHASPLKLSPQGRHWSTWPSIYSVSSSRRLGVTDTCWS